MAADSKGTGMDVATQLRITRQLLASGADPDAMNPHGETALNLAAWNGRLDLADMLLRAGADPALSGKASAKTPLISAVYNGHLAMVKRLVATGKVINTRNNHGWSALHFTANEDARNGSKDDGKRLAAIASVLIAHGADVNARNDEQATPLYLAAANDRPLVAKVLLAHGADASLTNDKGQTPATVARANGHPDMLALLQGPASKQPD